MLSAKLIPFASSPKPQNSDEPHSSTSVHTKVLIDTFVQWIRLFASGLITAVNAALIQIHGGQLTQLPSREFTN
jgi:hypothetical protein